MSDELKNLENSIVDAMLANLLMFLYLETSEQLRSKGIDWEKAQRVGLIDRVIRANFPTCLSKVLADPTSPILQPIGVADELD